jgi:hypothetical protein
MTLSTTPSRQELDEVFGARRRPTSDEMMAFSQRIRALVVRDERLHVVNLDEPTRTIINLAPVGEAVELVPVAQFYSFHTVNWAHMLFRPTLTEIFASMPPELLKDEKVSGVSVECIYGTSDFGGQSWHIGLATAYTTP